MDRRAFLRTVAGSGYALGMAQLLGVEDFLTAEDGSVPIVTALARSNPTDPTTLEKRTTTVPAGWYAAVTKSFELHSRLASTAVPGYLGSAVLPNDHETATAPIVVNLTREGFERATELIDRLLGTIPFDIDLVDDIPDTIEAEAAKEPRNMAAPTTDDRVPGGVLCRNELGDATLTPALYHPAHSQPFFATAGHLFSGIDDPQEKVLQLPREGAMTVSLGTVQQRYPETDVLVVDPARDLTPVSRIQATDSWRVSGQYTRMGLADLAARDQPLEKVAAQTGHTTGSIKGIDAVTCYTGTCQRGQLAWGEEADFTDGDSGSVSFHPDPDPATPEDAVLVASLNNARTWWPGQNFIWGVTAYHLRSVHGYHF